MSKRSKLAGIVAVASLWIATGIVSAATIYTDKSTYLTAAGTTGVATFEDLPVGQLYPFVSGGVLFTSGMGVTENLLAVPYAFWFGALGTPTHLAYFNPVGAPPAFVGLVATFPGDALAAGFIFNCIGCDIAPNTSALDWATIDAGGNTIEQGSVTVNLGGSAGQPPPGFLGLATSYPFRTLRVARRGLVPGTSGGNWVVDDVRYTAAPAIGPVPATAAGIPASDGWALLAGALMLGIAGATSLRRQVGG